MLEVWKVYPGSPRYKVSSKGRVKTTAHRTRPGHYDVECDIITPHNNGGKRKKNPYICLYPYLGASRVRRRLWHLVLETFVGPCPVGKQACHKDDDHGNNRVGNLYWGTPKENHADAMRNGLHPKGSTHGCSKLTEHIVRRIRRRIANRISTPSEEASRYSITRENIYLIIHRKTWTHI